MSRKKEQPTASLQIPKNEEAPTNGDLEQQIRTQRLHKVASSLALVDLDDEERAFLATCQRLYRNEAGVYTPFEEFFCNIVMPLEFDNWPTPEDIEEDLLTFRRDWMDLKSKSAEFCARYPD